jgi:hypothetical protein
MILVALSFFSAVLKTHVFPSSGSFTVRSNDLPGINLIFSANLFTLGGEYISGT